MVMGNRITQCGATVPTVAPIQGATQIISTYKKFMSAYVAAFNAGQPNDKTLVTLGGGNGAGCDERRYGPGIQIADPERKPRTQQVPCQLPAEVAQADEADVHAPARRMGGRWASRTAIRNEPIEGAARSQPRPVGPMSRMSLA